MNFEKSIITKCQQSSEPICRRVYNMNLALGYTEEFYSLASLAQIHNKSQEEMFDFAFDYIESRDCFRKEWAKMTSREECPLENSCLIDKCFSKKL
jgi:hypothetical protein